MTIEELINKNRENLNKTDLHIWKYIYSHKKECCDYSIYELAEKCNVSRTTILRFAQKLSLSGYSELKATLNFEYKENQSTFSEKEDANLIFESYKKVVDDLKKKNWDRVNQLIDKSDIIFGYASGVMQKNVLSELRRMFNNSGDYIIDIGNVGEGRHIIKHITPKSLVLIISLSGEKKEIVEFARELKLKEVPIISITRFSDNTLASLSDENIYVHMPKFIRVTSPSEESISSVGFFMAAEAMFVNYQLHKRGKQKKEN